MFQINQTISAHPHNVAQFHKALKSLLIVNCTFYALANLFQAELVPTAEDLILLLLGFLAVEIQSVNAIKAYVNLSIISVAIDFLSLLSVFFIVSAMQIPKVVDFIYFALFMVENYYKYNAITYARKIKEDWKSVQLPTGDEVLRSSA